MKINLREFTAEDFESELPHMIQDYAEEKVKNKHWAADKAQQLSTEAYQKLLPQGIKTPQHFLFYCVDTQSKKNVGSLWYQLRHSDFGEEAFLFNIEIFPDFRGCGFGRAAMQALEEKLKAVGVRFLSLHVFGDNTIAQNLYKSQKFKTTSVNMIKELL